MTGSIAFIRANLQHFGIQDMTVVARPIEGIWVTNYVLTSQDDHYYRGGMNAIPEKWISELCGNTPCRPFHVFADGMEPKSANQIGWIGCDRRFNFLAAPDLRTCLGWAIATDGGRERILSHIDLDVETQRLSAALVAMPKSFLRPKLFFWRARKKLENYFFGAWEKAVEATFRDEDTSRSSDGYYGVMTHLWRVGTRTLLGKEHPGFRFWY